MIDKEKAQRMRSGGATFQRIADEFRVSRQRIHQILSGYESYSLGRKKIKIEVLTHYGKGRLACMNCGFSDVRALSLDHIYNNGAEERGKLGKQGTGFYYWLKKRGYPNGYQTLCMNCQWLKK
jgi:hypothetical protein